MVYILEEEIDDNTDYISKNYSIELDLSHLKHDLDNDDNYDNPDYRFILIEDGEYWHEDYDGVSAIDDSDVIIIG